MSKPIFNPWLDQGEEYFEPSPYLSTDEDRPGQFWDWWSRNGEEATDMANAILCAIKPERCNGGNLPNNYPPPQQKDNTILFVFMGLILLLLIVVLFKK